MKYKYNKEHDSNIKTITIPVDIYNCRVEILMPKEAKVLSAKWEHEIDSDAITANHLNNSGLVLIRIYKYSDETLVHELVHAAQMIMSWIGHDHAQDEADEAFAYLVGYLFRGAKKGIGKYKKKVDKKK